MSKSKDYKPEDIMYPNQNIISNDLVKEMQTSFIEYAMSVIVARALPDVRDGLKPVHRRILYAMYEDNLTADKPFKKSATCVGDVLGRYHPHGDASVYDAMVRLAQNFSMRYQLVDGHGNFGSIDGDPPAAYRYTEARLSKLSNEMLRDIEKDTVNWDPNFDESRKEPRVLPSRFPNLLVNGSSGIAVGMATNIPPHNLTEVINACICVLDNPGATLADLMEHIQGPDFPTKGIIMGRSGIRAAYATGRGQDHRCGAGRNLKNTARIGSGSLSQSYPTRSTKSTWWRTLRTRSKKSGWKASPTCGTSRTGTACGSSSSCKRDANAQVVLNRLYAQTALQSGVLCQYAGAWYRTRHQPKILSLRHILDEYLTFQEELIIRQRRAMT